MSLRRLLAEPERWVDADMQRNALLRWVAVRLLAATIVTAAVIAVGVLL